MYIIIKTKEDAKKFCDTSYFNFANISGLKRFYITGGIIRDHYENKILCQDQDAVDLVWIYREEINKRILKMNLMILSLQKEKKQVGKGIRR